MSSPSQTCRATDCSNPVRYLSLCERHYHRAHRAGLTGHQINTLSPDEIVKRFGNGEKLPTTLGKKVVQATTDAQTDARIVESNIRLAKRVKELEGELVRARERAEELADRVLGAEKINKGLQVKAQELQATNENLAAQVLRLNQDLESLLSAPATTADASLLDSVAHKELVITQVDLDASSRLRVTLRGEGCRDVAHLVGRKVCVSRHKEQA